MIVENSLVDQHPFIETVMSSYRRLGARLVSRIPTYDTPVKDNDMYQKEEVNDEQFRLCPLSVVLLCHLIGMISVNIY